MLTGSTGEGVVVEEGDTICRNLFVEVDEEAGEEGGEKIG